MEYYIMQNTKSNVSNVYMKQIDVNDIDTLCHLNSTIFKNEVTYDKTYIGRFTRLKQGYILYENDLPVGYILYGMTMWKTKREFTIISLGVLETSRGKGYAKRLMLTVMNNYPNRDISLNVRLTNIKAQNLYKSLGFETVMIDKGYYWQLNDDALHMVYKKQKNN